jgi:hypothetical protein
MGEAAPSAGTLSQEDVDALEELVIKGKIDPLS